MGNSEMSDVSDSDEEEEPQMTEAEKRDAQNKLVPGLAEGEWGQKPGGGGVPSHAESTASAAARQSMLQPEVYDGASSDESEDMDVDGADDEPVQVDDEGQVEMDGEMDEFLRFTREALGLSEEQYQDILSSRRERGGEQHKNYSHPVVNPAR
jgi:hypothetical protein